MSTPLVSVITPVHNGEMYLRECIESVLAQSYENWDYTIVDNASTDATPQIVAAFAGRDARIRYVRYDQLVGANENHNRAFEAISPLSEYCKVLQADDWLYPECLQRMVGVAEQANSVGIVSAYRLWGQDVDLIGFPYSKTIVSGKEVLAQSLTGGPWVTGAPSALLLRSHFVRERIPFYQLDFEHADTEAAYWVMTQSDFALVHQVLTFARRQYGSRMTWASRMSTYLPENIRLLRRYGPSVLDRDVYRHQLRTELRRYLRFHARQCARLSRLRDKEFFAVHRTEADYILRDGESDNEVRAAMVVVKAMLARGGRAARFNPGDR